MKRYVYILVAALAFAFLGGAPGKAWAQNGKLSGTVTDAETGDPLPGVNVVLENTMLGAATDADGSYTIIGIAPGNYTVRFSLVGYADQVVEDVRIFSDRTRRLNAALDQTVIEGEEIVVQAERPVVQADQTASRTVFTGEEIQELPVTSLQEVVSNTAKSFEGFVRGSRRFGTTTVVEGIEITDTYARASSINTNTRPGYGSAIRTDEVSSSLINLSAGAISEVALNTGATEASAPAGSGGVVSVALREGRGPIGGTVSFRMAPSINQPGPDSLSFYPQKEAYFEERDRIRAEGDTLLASQYTWQEDTYDIGEAPEMNVNFSLSGGITDRWGFTAAGQFFQTEGFAPNTFNRRANGLLKTSYDVSPNTQITAVGLVQDNGLWGGWNNRNYSDLWRYYLVGTAQDDGGSYAASVRLRQVLSTHSFLTVQVYRTFARTRYGYADDDGDGWVEPGEDGEFINFYKTENIAKYNWIKQGPPEEKMFYGGPFPPGRSASVTNPRGEPIRAAGPMPYYEDTRRSVNTLKVDYDNQIHPNHLIQVGAALKLLNFDHLETRSELYEFDYTLNNELDVDGDGVLDVEPYAPSEWERSPVETAFYISDQMEYAGLIVNLGLRAEIIDRDTEQITDYFYPFERDTVMVDGRTVARNFFDRGEDVPLDVFWMPRIGVSHPIGERAAMYFSYARDQQLVPYSTLYDFYDGNHSANQFLVYQDPAQDPITSNNYELGVQWEFLEGWGLDLNAYVRSIENYGRTRLIASNRTPEGEPALRGLNRYTFETSAGYAEIKGIELQLQRRPLSLWEDVSLGLTASYTFSTVESNRNVGNKTRFNADEIEGTKLPFDRVDAFNHYLQGVRGGASVISSGYNRRHRALLRAIGTLPFGFSIGLDTRLESGFLFPKVVNADPRDRELLTAPTNFRIDLRLRKRFDLPGTFGFDVFMDITNLTNRDNIIAYNTRAPGAAARFQEEANPGSRLILVDGSPIYGPARNIYFGTSIRF